MTAPGTRDPLRAALALTSVVVLAGATAAVLLPGVPYLLAVAVAVAAVLALDQIR